jgi:hypothetical protein
MPCFVISGYLKSQPYTEPIVMVFHQPFSRRTLTVKTLVIGFSIIENVAIPQRGMNIDVQLGGHEK